MSESYTIGGDTLVSTQGPTWQGQTFTPIRDHALSFIDIECRGVPHTPAPVVRVFKANGNHKPFGDPIAHDRYVVQYNGGLFTTARCRFSMTPGQLSKDQYYAIIISTTPVILGNFIRWQYDAGDATYPRGMRISTPDSGATWDTHPNDDFMFAEWGIPPLKKAEPPPPIEYFAPLAYDHIDLANAVIIRVATSVPCHLWLYHTQVPPRKHPSAGETRGLKIPWYIYFCFVAYQILEQSEPGDTLYHTFVARDWLPGQTHWFALRGEVDTILSPSLSAIMKHVHRGQTLILNPSFEHWSAPPGDAPDHWQYTPAPHHFVFFPDVIHKTEGTYSCRCDNPVSFGNYYIHQDLDHSLLSGLTLNFKLAYRGKLTSWNWFRVRAFGDYNITAYGRPTREYQWEDLIPHIRLPPNLTDLYIQAQNMNQGDPVPFQTWWDDCRVELA